MNTITKSIPAISVIMPVWNGEAHIMEAVNSIIEQSFMNFEFIIVDDASTDGTKNYLDQIKDPRIIRINNKKQSGNYNCRNQGLNKARGKYICMMDADDIAYSNRLQIQYKYMETNSQYLAAGSDSENFNNSNSNIFYHLRNEHEIKIQLLADNVCRHPTLIIRKEVYEKYGITYNENYFYSADYAFMVDISKVGDISNISEVLLKYRIHNRQISYLRGLEQVSFRNQIQLRQLSNFQIRPSIEEIIIHHNLINEFYVPRKQLFLYKKWCNKLIARNAKLNIYHREYLYTFLKNKLKIAIEKSF